MLQDTPQNYIISQNTPQTWIEQVRVSFTFIGSDSELYRIIVARESLVGRTNPNTLFFILDRENKVVAKQIHNVYNLDQVIDQGGDLNMWNRMRIVRDSHTKEYTYINNGEAYPLTKEFLKDYIHALAAILE